jgi:hypothetical protein
MISLRLTTPRKAGIAILSIAVLFVTMRQTGGLASQLTASWSYDYRPQPACSVTQTRNCIDHFEVQDITDSAKFILIKSVENPNPAVGKVDAISVSFSYGPPFGARTISVVAVGRDAAGDRVTSNPYASRATVNIRPRAKLSLIF